MSNVDQLVLNKRDAAHVLAVSIRTINRLIAEGTLPVIRVRGSVRIPVAALRSIANGNANGGNGGGLDLDFGLDGRSV